MKTLRSLLLVGLAALPAQAVETVAPVLQPGESLTYQVGWALFGHAGQIKIAASTGTLADMPVTRVVTTTSTTGLARLLYRFDGEADMLIDAHDGRLLSALAKTRSRGERTQASVSFDYVNKEASYVDHLRPDRTTLLHLPEESRPLDLITSLVQTRTWSLAIGESRDMLVLFDDEFYELRITAEHEEILATTDGPRKALLLVPRMIGPPKGMFRRGGEVRVWVSADEDRLPLRFEVKLKVGTAYAVLSDYQSPARKIAGLK